MSDTPTSHLTKAQMRAYRDRRLMAADLLAVSDHLVDCAECRSSVVEPVELIAAFSRMRESFPEHLTSEDLVKFADGAADRETRSRVESHTAECEECAGELRVYKDLSNRFPTHSAPAGNQAGSWWSRLFPQTMTPFRVATAMGVLAAAAVIVWVARDRNPEVAVAPAAVKPSSQEQPVREADVVLRDAGMEIRVATGGDVSGLDRFAPADRDLLKRVLLSGRLEAPALRDLQRSGGALMSRSSGGELAGVRLAAPVGVVVEGAAPVFRWSAGAGKFRVAVFDDEFRPVADSGWVSGREWQAPNPLPRGRRYNWQLTVQEGGKDKLVPSPPAPEARFRILSEAEIGELQRVREASKGSSLLLAATYARIGLFDESEKELARLESQNPGSVLAARLKESLHGGSVLKQK